MYELDDRHKAAMCKTAQLLLLAADSLRYEFSSIAWKVPLLCGDIASRRYQGVMEYDRTMLHCAVNTAIDQLQDASRFAHILSSSDFSSAELEEFLAVAQGDEVDPVYASLQQLDSLFTAMLPAGDKTKSLGCTDSLALVLEIESASNEDVDYYTRAMVSPRVSYCALEEALVALQGIDNPDIAVFYDNIKSIKIWHAEILQDSIMSFVDKLNTIGEAFTTLRDNLPPSGKVLQARDELVTALKKYHASQDFLHEEYADKADNNARTRAKTQLSYINYVSTGMLGTQEVPPDLTPPVLVPRDTVR